MRKIDLSHDSLRLEGLATTVVWGGVIVGVLGLLASLIATTGSPQGAARFQHAYLVNFCFLRSLSRRFCNLCPGRYFFDRFNTTGASESSSRS